MFLAQGHRECKGNLMASDHYGWGDRLDNRRPERPTFCFFRPLGSIPTSFSPSSIGGDMKKHASNILILPFFLLYR